MIQSYLFVEVEVPFKILLLMHEAINGVVPFYLQELINLKEECKYKLRSDCDGLSCEIHDFNNVSRSIFCCCCSSTMDFIALCD